MAAEAPPPRKAGGSGGRAPRRHPQWGSASHRCGAGRPGGDGRTAHVGWEGDLVCEGPAQTKLKLPVEMGRCFVKGFTNWDSCPELCTEPVSWE